MTLGPQDSQPFSSSLVILGCLRTVLAAGGAGHLGLRPVPFGDWQDPSETVPTFSVPRTQRRTIRADQQIVPVVDTWLPPAFSHSVERPSVAAPQNGEDESTGQLALFRTGRCTCRCTFSFRLPLLRCGWSRRWSRGRPYTACRPRAALQLDSAIPEAQRCRFLEAPHLTTYHTRTRRNRH